MSEKYVHILWILIYRVKCFLERFVPVSTLCCPSTYRYQSPPELCWQRALPWAQGLQPPDHLQPREPAWGSCRPLRARLWNRFPRILSQSLLSSANIPWALVMVLVVQDQRFLDMTVLQYVNRLSVKKIQVKKTWDELHAKPYSWRLLY